MDFQIIDDSSKTGRLNLCSIYYQILPNFLNDIRFNHCFTLLFVNQHEDMGNWNGLPLPSSQFEILRFSSLILLVKSKKNYLSGYIIHICDHNQFHGNCPLQVLISGQRRKRKKSCRDIIDKKHIR